MRRGAHLDFGGLAVEVSQNAFIESFTGSLRDELLNEEIFESLADARRTLALWRYDYNNIRPHSSLGGRTPARARRTLDLKAPRPARLPNPKPTTINPKDSRYERGNFRGAGHRQWASDKRSEKGPFNVVEGSPLYGIFCE